MKDGLKVGWNREWVKGVSKTAFVKNHKDAFPGVDLEAEYDKIVPTKKEVLKSDDK